MKRVLELQKYDRYHFETSYLGRRDVSQGKKKKVTFGPPQPDDPLKFTREAGREDVRSDMPLKNILKGIMWLGRTKY